MVLHANCPQCGHPHQFADRKSGTIAACKECGHVLYVPDPENDDPFLAEDDFTEKPKKKKDKVLDSLARRKKKNKLNWRAVDKLNQISESASLQTLPSAHSVPSVPNPSKRKRNRRSFWGTLLHFMRFGRSRSDEFWGKK